MGRRIYTIILKDGSNDYVTGRVSGIITALSGGRSAQDFAHGKLTEKSTEIIVRVRTTPNKYQKIKDVIEWQYPELCTFE